MKLVDTKTNVPLGWIFVLLSCSGSALLIATGAGLYAGRVEGRAISVSREIDEVKSSTRNQNEVLRTIDQRLSRIEGALNVKRGARIDSGRGD